jgi:hypothetical protein
MRFIKYCKIEDPFFLRHKVERMKKMETQMMSLLRMNIPAEQQIRERKLVPSGSSWTTSFEGS